MKKIALYFVAIIALLVIGKPSDAMAGEKFITIGTGSIYGVYYPTGGAICQLVNRNRKSHGIRCTLESTSGSIYNLESLAKKDLDIALAQSDWQYNAYNGSGPFADDGPNKKLRSMFSLHKEAFTVVVRRDSGIKKFDDIKGKRVNIGNPGSGVVATMHAIMQSKGWTDKSFKVASELKPSEQAQALCDNKIDVMVYSVGHPNVAVQEATRLCDAVIINIDSAEIEKLVQNNPYYVWTTISGGMYNGNPTDIKTIGTKATLVTTEDEDEETVYQLVKAVFDNFDNFKSLNPVFADLDPKKLVAEGNTAPLHKGAERYFKEKGYIE